MSRGGEEDAEVGEVNEVALVWLEEDGVGWIVYEYWAMYARNKQRVYNRSGRLPTGSVSAPRHFSTVTTNKHRPTCQHSPSKLRPIERDNLQKYPGNPNSCCLTR